MENNQEVQSKEFNQFKAKKTLDTVLDETDSKKVNKIINSQSDEQLSYLQEAVEEKIISEVSKSKQSANNDPEYKRELIEYEREYAQWEDDVILIGAYGNAGPEPTTPSAPSRKISTTEASLTNINNKISNEIEARENNKQQVQEINTKTGSISIEDSTSQTSNITPSTSKWANFVAPERANQPNASRQEKQVKWADQNGIAPLTRGANYKG
jgi:hypothetical protein